MTTNLDALKELAESLGIESEATTSAEVISEIAKAGVVPKVTSANNGQVMGVVEGKWAPVTLSGGITFAGGAS